MPDAKMSSVPRAGEGSRASGDPPRRAEDPQRAAPQGPAKPRGEDEQGGFLRPGVVNVKLIYSAYLVAIAIPVAALFGGYFAYRGQKTRPSAWLMTHYVYQMRTFWIGLGANLVAWVLSYVGVGLILFPLIAVWVVARAVNGLIRVAQRAPIDDPNSLLI